MILRRVFAFCASVRLAVLVILGLIVITAWGTVVESRTDARTAQELVYHSPYMYTNIALLALNLICAMVSRWPFRRRHIPFVLAHIGLLLIIGGSLLTHYRGIDGIVSLKVGEEKTWLTLPESYLRIYHSHKGDSFLATPLYAARVRLLRTDLERYPLEVALSGQHLPAPATFYFDDYLPYAYRRTKMQPAPSSPFAQPAVHLSLQSRFAQHTQWLTTPRGEPNTQTVGPLTLRFFPEGWQLPTLAPTGASGGGAAGTDGGLASGVGAVGGLASGADGSALEARAAGVDKRAGAEEPASEAHRLELQPAEGGDLFYRLIREGMLWKQGHLAGGDMVTTPWMDLRLRILSWLPQAESAHTYAKMERPTELSTEAVRVRFGNETKWVGLNSFVRFAVGSHESEQRESSQVELASLPPLAGGGALDKGYFIVAYTHNRIGLGLRLQLQKFAVQHYPGSQIPASYKSHVLVDGQPVEISMNQPFSKNGLTFYQASFQEDALGNPVISILSVNRDPGRFWKYLGSLVLVLGIIWLFAKRHPVLARWHIA